MSIWFWFWVVLAVILIVLEIFTAGFFMLPFGIGAIAAAVVTVFAEEAVVWQWVAFLLVSFVSLVALRRVAARITHEPPEKVGADRVLGKTGIVIEELDPTSTKGRVRIETEEWRAETPDGTPLPVGVKVRVERIEGARVIVVPLDEPATSAGTATDTSV
ncbi:MAG: hypothetical protein Kow0056_07990 [Coriobacteriia bacterium]